mmetsp:Transcript_57212/g.104521  ORF Transcript_57212/g.104521 Transcript_57212/m.104521 type:complete len:249 (-) Transcript_57212:954-1700(-)
MKSLHFSPLMSKVTCQSSRSFGSCNRQGLLESRVAWMVVTWFLLASFLIKPAVLDCKALAWTSLRPSTAYQFQSCWSLGSPYFPGFKSLNLDLSASWRGYNVPLSSSHLLRSMSLSMSSPSPSSTIALALSSSKLVVSFVTPLINSRTSVLPKTASSSSSWSLSRTPKMPEERPRLRRSTARFLSSTESSVKRQYALTGSRDVIRCTRQVACRSNAGFHTLSMCMTHRASGRFKPNAPTLTDSSNTCE